MTQLLVKKTNSNGIIPTRGSSNAIGLDLYSNETVVIPAGKQMIVSTGIAIKTPPGTYGRIAPRSGLAVKYGIHVGAGVIDPDYTGEVGVVLFNLGTESFQVKSGDRIAQLILEQAVMAQVHVVESLTVTSRGSSGFGSTGK